MLARAIQRWSVVVALVLAAGADADGEHPLVVKAFRRSASSGRVDLIGQSPSPDGEPDMVFELVVDGDFSRVCVRNERLSVEGCSLQAFDEKPTPSATAAMVAPPSRPAVAPTKHAPHLFVFDTASADATRARRTVRSRAGYARCDSIPGHHSRSR